MDINVNPVLDCIKNIDDDIVNIRKIEANMPMSYRNIDGMPQKIEHLIRSLKSERNALKTKKNTLLHKPQANAEALTRKIDGLLGKALHAQKNSHLVLEKFCELETLAKALDIGLTERENDLSKQNLQVGMEKKLKLVLESKISEIQILLDGFKTQSAELPTTLPCLDVDILFRHVRFGSTELQKEVDTSGLAEEMNSYDFVQGSDVGYRHMLKRIYLIKLLLNECFRYSKEIRSHGYVIGNRICTMQAFYPSSTTYRCSMAHISMISQVQLLTAERKKEIASLLDNRQRGSSFIGVHGNPLVARLLNSEVDLKPYFEWIKSGPMPLNHILNTADSVAHCVNNVDDIGEFHVREFFFEKLNDIVRGADVGLGFSQIVQKLLETYSILEKNLIAGQNEYSYDISCPSNQKHLFKDSWTINKALFVTRGMLKALRAFAQQTGPLPPLKSPCKAKYVTNLQPEECTLIQGLIDELQAMEADAWDQHIAKANQILAHKSDDPTALFYRGRAFYHQDQPEQAYADILAAYAAMPNDPVHAAYMGAIHHYFNEHAEATSCLEQACFFNDIEAKTPHLLPKQLLASSQKIQKLILNIESLDEMAWYQHIFMATSILDLKADEPTALYYRGKAYFHLGRDDSAYNDMAKAQSMWPNDESVNAYMLILSQSLDS